MADRYDVIVIGIGSMGAAICWQLARRGVRVLGLEQFSIPHEQGSHHGSSRLIRLAYSEHPNYVTLLKRAYELWDQIEADSGQKLLHITGGLYLGREDCELVAGSLAAAREHHLPHEMLDRTQLDRRFPYFRVPDDFVGFYEDKAGFVMPTRTVAAYACEAQRRGAELHGCEAVESWSADDRGVTVRTDRGTYRADRLVITGGAWSGQLLAELHLDLVVTRQVLAWVWPRMPELFALGKMPVWALDMQPKGHYAGTHYGPPMIPEEPGFKIALHQRGEVTQPDKVDRGFRAADEQTFRPILREVIPDANGPLLAYRTCLYTNTPDGHFILDRHPKHANVHLAAGFSGHGFKFAPVIGQIMADLATDGRTDLPIAFLGLSRFAKS